MSEIKPSMCSFWIKQGSILWCCGLSKNHEGDHMIAIPKINVEKQVVKK